MEIFNTTKKELATIEILSNGIDCMRDIIGDCDDLSWNDDADRYEMDQDGVDWWLEYADGINEVDAEKKELEDEFYGSNPEKFEELETAWESGDWNDMEMEPVFKKVLLSDLKKLLTSKK